MARCNYNIAFKQKIIDDYNAETAKSESCKKYEMSKAVKSRLVNKYKTIRTVETKDLGGRRRKVLLILIVKL